MKSMCIYVIYCPGHKRISVLRPDSKYIKSLFTHLYFLDVDFLSISKYSCPYLEDIKKKSSLFVSTFYVLLQLDWKKEKTL